MQRYAIIAGCFFLLANCASSAENVIRAPYQADPTVTTQSTKVGLDSAASPFIGTWCGYWWNSEPGELTVSEVTDSGRVTGIVLWRAWKNYRGTVRAGEVDDRLIKAAEFEGRIVNGELTFTQEFRNSTISYRFRDDGTLAGNWARDDGTWIVDFKRCDGDAPRATEKDTSNYQAFLGDWCGKWQQSPWKWPRKTMITVQEITGDGFASLIYTGHGRKRTSSRLYKGVVVNGNLRFSIHEDAARFTLDQYGLSGSTSSPRGQNEIQMHRCTYEERVDYTNTHERAFLGHWCGNWKNDFSRLLILWVNHNDDAQGIYTYKYKSYSTSWAPFRGRISNGKLEFAVKNGAELQYWLENDSKLAGTFRMPGTYATISATPCPQDGEFGVLD